MTREKQLNKAAFDYVDQEGTTAEWSDGWEDFNDAEYIEEAFKEGAEWEYKRLIHIACEWLMNNAHLYVYATTKEKRALMFEDFKRTIEE